jgi:two-component system CheB/CheR fusion protein
VDGINPPNLEFEALLDYLKDSRSFDFSGYKRSSLVRRVDKRMQSVGVGGYRDYIDYLEVHPEEFALLFNTILINVTTFFRDTAAWEYLSGEIVPRLLASKSADDPIRVWSAGCASGQESYSLAMALAENLGFSAFRERVKIYATDIDEEALGQARQAIYTPREVEGIPAPLLEKYFAFEGERYVFHPDLRRALIFGRHDLLQDAPISRIDLLACRNTLMYFHTEAQAQIIARFHFALENSGYLFLGKAEMIFSHAGLFLPMDLKRRIFLKVAVPGLRDRLLQMAQRGPETPSVVVEPHLRFREAIFDAGPLAQIVVSGTGLLAMANERARALFYLTARDLGRPLQDLEISYRPLELRSCIEEAYAERRMVTVKDVAYTMRGGETSTLDVQIIPLMEGDAPLGVSIAFTDMTRFRRLSKELEAARLGIETAYEEIQSTNEELETTNEELQSTVEELETTNEELQSTNEELETTNEELQSTNEELQTINEEFRQRSEELNQVNVYLESILSSLNGGVIVLDRSLQVQIWNNRSQELWGMRSEEVQGKPFLTLDIGLPVEQLISAVRACLTDRTADQRLLLKARNRRGKAIQCQVTLTPMIGREDKVHGVILLVEEQTAAVLDAV